MVITAHHQQPLLSRVPARAAASPDRVSLSGRKGPETYGWVAGGTSLAAGFGALGGLAAGSLGFWGVPAAAVGGAILGGALGYGIVHNAHDGSVKGGMLVFGGMTGGAAALAGSIAGVACSSHPILAGAAAAGAVALGAGIYYGFIAN